MQNCSLFQIFWRPCINVMLFIFLLSKIQQNIYNLRTNYVYQSIQCKTNPVLKMVLFLSVQIILPKDFFKIFKLLNYIYFITSYHYCKMYCCFTYMYKSNISCIIYFMLLKIKSIFIYLFIIYYLTHFHAALK